MKTKFCPKCKGEVVMVAGGSVGLFECKKCRFRGSIFPEKENKKGGKKKHDK